MKNNTISEKPQFPNIPNCVFSLFLLFFKFLCFVVKYFFKTAFISKKKKFPKNSFHYQLQDLIIETVYYRIYLQYRLVINNLAKECSDEWVTSTCGINSLDMESLNSSMEILYSNKPIENNSVLGKSRPFMIK
jgi:hypothetical protein